MDQPLRIVVVEPDAERARAIAQALTEDGTCHATIVAEMSGLGRRTAKGSPMKARGLSEEAAYALLRRTAMDQKRRLADVAQALVTAAGMLS